MNGPSESRRTITAHWLISCDAINEKNLHSTYRIDFGMRPVITMSARRNPSTDYGERSTLRKYLSEPIQLLQFRTPVDLSLATTECWEKNQWLVNWQVNPWRSSVISIYDDSIVFDVRTLANPFLIASASTGETQSDTYLVITAVNRFECRSTSIQVPEVVKMYFMQPY